MGYVYDYSKLKGKITEKLGNQGAFSRMMGLSETTIISKLNGKVEFKQSEILKACSILGIESENITTYFFKYKVKKNETNHNLIQNK